MKGTICTYLKTHQTAILRGVYALWMMGLLGVLMANVYTVFVPNLSYYNWNISDWMINYQGGFVRRGLAGEILWQMYQWHPLPIYIAIYACMGLTFVALIGVLVYIFKRSNLSLAYLVVPFFIIGAFCYDPLSTRRDYLSLLLMIAIYALYAAYIHHKRRKSMVLMQVLSVITLLLHEAAFFYTIPLLFFHYWLTKNKTYHLWWKTLLMAIVFFAPALLTLMLVSMFHGTQDVANAIWSSWQPCMDAYPLSNNPEARTMGAGINALTWGLTETAEKHFTLNFGGYFLWKIPACLFAIYNFVAMYYLTTKMNTIDLKINPIKSVNQVQLSNFLLAQFVFMLPMFTILSCDSWRTYSYWLVSALVGFYYFKDDSNIIPSSLTAVSTQIQHRINANTWLTNPWIYILILFTFPMPIIGGPDFFRILPVKLIDKLLPIIQSFF